jgi:hypothetical protein
MGDSEKIEDDPEGIKVKTLVDDIAGVLKTKYGRSDPVDYCDGDEDDCQNAWLEKNSEGDARHGYTWELSDTRRADRVARIAVTAVAGSATESYAGIGYYSAESEKCDAAEKALKASSL